MADKGDVDYCLKCKNVVSVEALLCDICELWIHRGCTTMSSRTYNQIIKSSKPWSCSVCKEKTKTNAAQPALLQTIKELSIKFDECTNAMKRMELENRRLREEMLQMKTNAGDDVETLENILTINGVEIGETDRNKLIGLIHSIKTQIAKDAFIQIEHRENNVVLLKIKKNQDKIEVINNNQQYSKYCVLYTNYNPINVRISVGAGSMFAKKAGSGGLYNINSDNDIMMFVQTLSK